MYPCAPVFTLAAIRFVGIDVHGELETRIHAHQHIAENEFAVAVDANAHE